MIRRIAAVPDSQRRGPQGDQSLAEQLQPVLDVIVETSRECFAMADSVIFLPARRQVLLRRRIQHQTGIIEALRANPISPDQVGSVLARTAREKRTIHVPNTAEDPEAGFGGR